MNKNLGNQLIKIFLLGAVLFFCFSCEERDFRKAVEKNTTEAIEQFLKKHPDGKYTMDALASLALLHYQKAVAENTVSGYEDFLKRFPKSSLKPTVIKNLIQLVSPEVNALSPEQISHHRALLKTDYGVIKIRFYPDKAPEHCRNFIRLAKSHFYDDSQFHLIIPGVLVQGGAPEGDPEAGPGWTIKAEFNDLINQPGAVGMIRGEHPDSASSQFYIALSRIEQWDGRLTIFGQVEEGLEVAMEISQAPNSGAQGRPYPFKPLKEIIIQGIEIIYQN